MSARLPLGRLLNVGGNNDTCCNQTVPGAAVVILKIFSLEGFMPLVFKSASNFFQSPVSPEISPLATVLPLVLSRLTVSGPVKPLAAFA